MKRMIINTALSALVCASVASADTAVLQEGELYLPRGIRCMAGKVPFDRALFLETKDLAPGEVKLTVHNLQVAFTLED